MSNPSKEAQPPQDSRLIINKTGDVLPSYISQGIEARYRDVKLKKPLIGKPRIVVDVGRDGSIEVTATLLMEMGKTKKPTELHDTTWFNEDGTFMSGLYNKWEGSLFMSWGCVAHEMHNKNVYSSSKDDSHNLYMEHRQEHHGLVIASSDR